MKKADEQIAFPVFHVVVMMAFLFAFFFANANPSLAASTAKKIPEVAPISAVEHTEARIKELQSALKITDSQKELWNTFTQVMRDNAKDMDALTNDMAKRTKTMNAIEHLKLYSQITEARLNHLKKVIPPFEALYTSMSDEQKKNIDALFQKRSDRKNKTK